MIVYSYTVSTVFNGTWNVFDPSFQKTVIMAVTCVSAAFADKTSSRLKILLRLLDSHLMQ